MERLPLIERLQWTLLLIVGAIAIWMAATTPLDTFLQWCYRIDSSF